MLTSSECSHPNLLFVKRIMLTSSELLTFDSFIPKKNNVNKFGMFTSESFIREKE